jgi:hypothetical protein
LLFELGSILGALLNIYNNKKREYNQMTDFIQAGKCQVVLSTSNDDRFPASNILDGSPETFWISTGMFPQEITLKFNLDKVETQRPTLAKISKIELYSTNSRYFDL